MIKKLIYMFFTIVCVLFITSCKCSNSKKGDLQVPPEIENQGITDISDDAITNIVENISSPVEIAALIKSMNVPFSKSYLAPTDYTSNYTTSFSKAFALGVFSADLGYLNMYEKTGSVIDYITTIKELANGINVGQFFDFTTLKRLASNSSNLDSMKYISVHSFNQMDKYLRENKRGSLSALIIAGAWIEGIYFATQISTSKPDVKLAERIGEQKIILADLMILIRNYSNDPSFKKYVDDFELIKSKFNDITITYEMGEPVPVEENGMLTIKQTEKSIVHISDEQMKEITKAIESVRNKLIKM
jgi:hypothetical protein